MEEMPRARVRAAPDPQLWKLWEAWTYVFDAMVIIAPEVLEDLKGLIPLYKKAKRPFQKHRIYGKEWESLELTIQRIQGSQGEEAARILASELKAWGKRWHLDHPIPLSCALQSLSFWSKWDMPGRPWVVYYPYVGAPPYPEWNPPPAKIPHRRIAPLPEIKAKLYSYFETWLAQYEAELRRWQLRRRELEKHAYWWVAHRIKGWSIRTMHQRAREEGLVKGGRVLIEKASPATISEAISRLDRELNYPAQELNPPTP